ncbi:MAG: TonB-dependent receptor [Lewinellaceae bacterium]|nr:TonB-dependent receptor [Saprospiraceae bacterium]MCB9354706.1 TonB-dependent receptor [Lewinellaceae bacterium]
MRQFLTNPEGRRLVMSLLLLMLFAPILSAQFRVTGKVTDASDGSPIIGATVKERGTTNGAITDVDGSYALTVADDRAVLVLNYTGYAEQIVEVEGRAAIDVVMSVSENLIEQVVVIGYGTQKKSDLTGAVGNIKAKDIERIPGSSLEQALQGKLAGVYVVPASGMPGSGATIRIRGTGTLNNASPLFVVDGMLLDDISFLNPQDVESVEVLKDASATAIYGNRGANGVIIITTKRGNKGERALISFSSYYGSQAVTRQIPMANAAQFGQLYNELTNSNYYADPAALGEGTNWQDVIFRDAPIANAQISANGGSDKFLYNISANYFKQEGIVRESEFQRITVRFNNEYQVNPFIRLGNNLAFNNYKVQNPPNVVESAYRMPPVFAERDSTGAFSDPTFFGGAIGNPAADLYYKNNNHAGGNRLVGTVYGDIKLFKYFTFRSNFGVDLFYINSKYYEPVFMVSNSQLNNEDKLNLGYNEARTWLWENTLTYDQEWDWLHLNVLGGYTSQERHFEDFGAGRRNFPSGEDELLYLNAGDVLTQTNSGGAGEWAMVSYLGRTNITLFDRYLLTASLRADGSSRFSPDNRWGYFPSFAVGWNITQEPFMSAQRIFDRLKIRASWGIVGNDKTQLYPSFGTITGGLGAIFGPNETLNQGASLIFLSNPDVRWESARQTDVGLELALLQGRFSAEVDWYNRYTYDILSQPPIPAYVGSQGIPVVNVADVLNRGWDLTLNWRETRNRFSYNVSLIYSTVHNEVKKLDKRRSQIPNGGTAQGDLATLTIVGQPIGTFYGFVTDGVFQTADEAASSPRLGNETAGDLKYKDINGRDADGNLTGLPDGKIDADDRTFLGSPIPDFNYGFSLGFEFMGVDVAADFFGVSGNKVVNAKALSRFAVYNWEESFYDGRWTGAGTTNEKPRITNGGHNYRMSDYWVEDGSFFRMRSLAIGYSLPRMVISKIGLSRFRIYASGTNLWTKQQYSGYSPEFPGSSVFTSGIDYNPYPISKTYLLGFDVSF